MGLTGRALAGATLGILITLATSSSWQYIPVTYWPVLGMTAAYIGVAYRWANAQTTSTARQVDAGARFVGQGAPRPSPAKPTPGLPGNLPRPGVARRLHRSR
jgi:hypothetical protein